MDDIYYCFHCYGRNDRPSGTCVHCGREIAVPAGASYDERLIWALRHPDPDRAGVAAGILGERRAVVAVPALRCVVRDPPDAYVAARALQSLIAIAGVDAERELLEEVAAGDSFIPATVAQRALGR
jgi:hypothetical protein